MIKFIAKYLKRYIKIFLIYTVISLIILFIGLYSPYIESKVIDQLVYNPSKVILFKMVFYIFILNMLSIILLYIQNIILIKLKNIISFDISNNIINHLKKVNILDIANYDSAYLSNRISNDSDIIISFFLTNVVKFITNIVTIIFCSSWLLYNYEFKIIIIILSIIPIYIFIYLLLKKPLYIQKLRLLENQSFFFCILNRILKNIKVIKTKVLFEKTEQEYKNSFYNLFKSIISFNKISYIFSSLNNICTTLLRILILLFMGIKIIQGELTIGQFTLISSYCNMIIISITYYLTLSENYQNTKASFLRIKEFLEIKKENNGKIILNNINKIEVKNLSFSYDSTNTLIKNFSYKFNKGKIYSIIGSNGSGKTTLIDLILGLINTTLTGEIFYDQNNINDLDMYLIRKKLVAFVSQEPYLIVDTIYNNFTYNLNYIDQDNLNKLLIEFNLKEKIDSFPKKYNTIINDNIKNLSGGERQKIALINAILSNTDILILDEPTSALDQKSNNVLKNILKEIKYNKIIIIISHDENFYNIADEIIHIK